jgi:hypothetical protein
MQKNDVIGGGGAGYLGKYDFTQGQANSTGIPFDQKVIEAVDLTYISTNIGHYFSQRFHQPT